MVNSLRNNFNALNASNYLTGYNNKIAGTYAQISSGLAINHPQDDAPSFVNSEQLRTRVSDIKQVQKNTSTAISMVQLAETGLNDINNLLVNMRQVAIHSANDAVNSPVSLKADQEEINNSIRELDSIFANLAFGKKFMFKNESGTNGYSNISGLSIVAASEITKSSGVDGYSVVLTGLPTAANITALKELTEADLSDEPLKIKILTAKGNIDFESSSGQKPIDIVNQLNALLDKNQSGVYASIDAKNIITFTSVTFGSKPSFQISVNKDGLFSNKANDVVKSTLGHDIQGMVNGEQFVGSGSVINGKKGGRTDGLILHYAAPNEITFKTEFDKQGMPIFNQSGDLKELPYELGRVFITNNSLTYHDGNEYGQLDKFSLPEINSLKLANFILNKSNFKSINELDVTKFQGAQDSILLLTKAIAEITVLRGDIGSFQKNILEQNQSHLAEKYEQIVSSESQIRDQDMALAAVNLAKQQIQQGSAVEVIRNANINKADVLRLFRR